MRLYSLPIFVLSAVFTFGTVILVNFIVDPLQAVHRSFYQPAQFYQDERHQMPGLARHYTEEIVVLGPSTMQLFHSEMVSEIFGKKAVNLTVGGSSLYEQRLLLDIALASGKVRQVIWGVEWVSTAKKASQTRADFGHFPHHLYGLKPDTLVYLASFPTLKLSLKAYGSHLGIVRSGDFSSDMQATKRWDRRAVFSEKRVIENYLSPEFLTLENHLMPKRGNAYIDDARDNLDRNLTAIIKQNPNVNFLIFQPPHSIIARLYLEENFKDIVDLLHYQRAYFRDLQKMPNVTIHDFESIPEVVKKLNEYSDMRHYSPYIARYIVTMLASGQKRMSEKESQDGLEEMLHGIKTICRDPRAILNGYLQGKPSDVISSNCLRQLGMAPI